MYYDDIISLQIDEEGFLREIKKIANPENFIMFLNLCSRNITMSFRNQVALFGQVKEIYNACGIKARVQRSDVEFDKMAIATALYYNLMHTDDGFVVEYVPIKVVGDTPETFKGNPFEQNFFDDNMEKQRQVIPDLIAQTGLVVELVPKAHLRHPTNKADYDVNRKLIQVANGLNNRQHSEALVSAFTRYALETKGYTDKILQLSVIYVVSKYFKLKSQHGIQGVLFNQVFEYNEKEFAEFLELVSDLSFKVIQDLIGQILSFDETSLVNIFLDETNVEDFGQYLIEIQQETEDMSAIKMLSELAEKVEGSTLSSMEHLLALKETKGAIYTYPPFRFERNQNY